MSLPVQELRGITGSVADALKAQGLSNSETLLEATKTATLRRQLAAAVGVETSVILDLANRADLNRISGIGGVYSDLLEEAGVDTVKELSHRSPENLYAKINEINQVRQLTQRPPTLDQITDFINQAKTLPAGLEY
jgi:predicted flap endonuclease-1-like 5' DNA nuclease